MPWGKNDKPVSSGRTFQARTADRQDAEFALSQRNSNLSAGNLDLARAREAREAQGQTTGTLPTGYRWADAAHTKQEIIPGGPADASGGTETGGLSEKAMVKALVDGRMAFPSGAALRNPYWQNLLSQVAQADPNFDQVNYNARAATRKDFTSGASAKNITAFNTALGHLGTLYDTSKELKNGNFTPWNALGNAVNKLTGDPSVDKFNTAAHAAVDELEKAFRGSGGTQAGIEEWKQSLNASQSPAQTRAVIGQMVDLLGSRINALGEQYKSGMGRSIDGVTLLDPHAQAVFNALGPNGNGKVVVPQHNNNPLEGGSGIAGQSGGDNGGGGGAAPNQPGLTPSSGSERTFVTQRDQAFADESQKAFAGGASRQQMDAIADKYGAQPFGPELDKAIAGRATNLGVQFAPTATGREETGLTGAVAGALGSNAGSFAAGVGNAATFGQLDNIAEATGSSEGGTDVAMRLARSNGVPYFAGSMAGDTAALLAGGAGMAKAAGKVASPTVAALLGNPLTADVAFGAAQGAGNAEDPLYGAVGGALLAGAGSLGGQAAGKWAAGLRSPKGVSGLNAGETMVNDAVNKTSRGSVVDALTQADSLGVPGSIADFSPEANALTGAAIRRSPTVAGMARDTLIPRGRGQIDRFGQAVERDLGPTANIPQLSEDIMRQASADASPLYQQAYANPVVSTPELSSLLQTPFGRQAIGRAQKIAANERRNPEAMGFALDADGNVVLNPVPEQALGVLGKAESDAFAASEALKRAQTTQLTGAGTNVSQAQATHDAAQQALAEARAGMAAQPSAGTAATQGGYTTQTLDYAKRGMDDVLEQYRNPITNRLVLDEAGKAENSVKNALLKEVDRINPAYGQARAAYAGPAQSKDALMRGQDALTLSPDQLAMQVGNQTPEDLAQMQLGYRSQAMNAAEGYRKSSNPFEGVYGTVAAEKRLSLMHPDNPSGVANLLAQRDLEGQLAGSSNRMIGNSLTAERLGADEAFANSPMVEGALHAGAALATHGASIPGTAARMIGPWVKDRVALGFGKSAAAKAEQLALIALDIDPASAITRLDDLTQRQQQYEVAKALLAAQGARPGAIVGTSGVAALLSTLGSN